MGGGWLSQRWISNAAPDKPLPLPVRLESIKRRVFDDTTDALDGVDDVRQTWDERVSRHQNTGTAPASMR